MIMRTEISIYYDTNLGNIKCKDKSRQRSFVRLEPKHAKET